MGTTPQEELLYTLLRLWIVARSQLPSCALRERKEDTISGEAIKETEQGKIMYKINEKIMAWLNPETIILQPLSTLEN